MAGEELDILLKIKRIDLYRAYVVNAHVDGTRPQKS
jgi:hypothetical protein